MTARKPPATAWRKGQSGNPAGRPKGIRDRRHALRELIEPHARELIHKALELARAGDVAALRLLLERAVPPLKPVGELVKFDLPAGDLPTAAHAVLKAAADGELAPGQAREFLAALADLGRLIELHDLEQRITRLEENR